MKRFTSLYVLHVFLVLFILHEGNAQGYWSKHYGGKWDDYSHDFVLLPDNTGLISGYSRLPDGNLKDIWYLKIDSFGDTLWTKRYGGKNNDIGGRVIPLHDGSLLSECFYESFDPGDTEIFIQKIDTDGNEITSRRYGTEFDDLGRFFVPYHDSTVLLAAEISEWNGPGRDSWLLKLDSNGDTLWTYKLIDSDRNYPRDIFVYPDNTSQLVEKYSTKEFPDSNFIRINTFSSDGILLNRNTFSTGETIYESGIQLENETCMLFLWTRKTNQPTLSIVFIDKRGNVITSKEYSNSEIGILGDVVRGHNGKVYCVGFMEDISTGQKSGWCAAVNTEGVLLWSKSFSQKGSIWFNQAYVLPSGNVLCGGKSMKDTYSASNVLLMEINTDGSEIWKKTYEHPYGSYITDIHALDETRLLFVGNYEPDTTGFGNIWLMSLIPSQCAYTKKEFTFSIPVKGNPKDYSYHRLEGPESMKISDEGTISWTPSQTISSLEDIAIEVTNSYKQSDTLTFTLTVNPHITPINNKTFNSIQFNTTLYYSQTHNSLVFKSMDQGIHRIELYDLKGKKIALLPCNVTSGKTNCTINIPLSGITVSQGCFLVKAFGYRYTLSKKIIISMNY